MLSEGCNDDGTWMDYEVYPGPNEEALAETIASGPIPQWQPKPGEMVMVNGSPFGFVTSTSSGLGSSGSVVTVATDGRFRTIQRPQSY